MPLAILGAQALYTRWRSEPGGVPLASLTRPAAVRVVVAAMPGIAMLAFTAYLRWLTGVWFVWARMQEAWGKIVGSQAAGPGMGVARRPKG